MCRHVALLISTLGRLLFRYRCEKHTKIWGLVQIPSLKTKFYRNIWEKDWPLKEFVKRLKLTPIFEEGTAKQRMSAKHAENEELYQQVQDEAISSSKDIATKDGDTPGEVTDATVRDARQVVVCYALCQKRFGMSFLLLVYSMSYGLRGRSPMSYALTEGTTYEKKLQHMKSKLGRSYIGLILAAVNFGWGQLTLKKDSGGLSNHPFFPQSSGMPGISRTNALIETYMDGVTEIFESLEKHAKEDTKLSKAYELKEKNARIWYYYHGTWGYHVFIVYFYINTTTYGSTHIILRTRHLGDTYIYIV